MSRGLRKLIERFFLSRISECTALTVTATRQLTPHMMRVSFAGKGLEAFDTLEHFHVRLLLPPQGAPRDRWLTADRTGKALLRDKAYEPVFRKYTIRSIDGAAGTLDVDFVLHADGGPGAAWAAVASPGDVVGVIGPGGRGLVTADWLVLAGDETALPAIARMVPHLPRKTRGAVLIEVADAQEEQALDVPDGMVVRWLHREGAGSGLADEIQALDWPSDTDDVFVWVAAEFRTVGKVRAYLKRVRKLDKHQQLAVAYWRHEGPSQASGKAPA